MQSDSRSKRFNIPDAHPVAGVDPVDGWTLFRYEEQDSDHFWRPAYYASGPDRDVTLPVSRFGFTPSQSRFAWLVRNGFPQFYGMGNWNDTELEHEIETESVAA